MCERLRRFHTYGLTVRKILPYNVCKSVEFLRRFLLCILFLYPGMDSYKPNYSCCYSSNLGNLILFNSPLTC